MNDHASDDIISILHEVEPRARYQILANVLVEVVPDTGHDVRRYMMGLMKDVVSHVNKHKHGHGHDEDYDEGWLEELEDWVCREFAWLRDRF